MQLAIKATGEVTFVGMVIQRVSKRAGNRYAKTGLAIIDPEKLLFGGMTPDPSRWSSITRSI